MAIFLLNDAILTVKGFEKVGGTAQEAYSPTLGLIGAEHGPFPEVRTSTHRVLFSTSGGERYYINLTNYKPYMFFCPLSVTVLGRSCSGHTLKGTPVP